MKTTLLALCLIATLTAGSTPLLAQDGRPPRPEREGGERGERGERGREGGREGGERGERGREGGREGMLLRMLPVMVALDSNTNGVIEAEEMANATASLKKLDKNGDGKLTEDELRPTPPARGTGSEAQAMVTRLMQFDKNADGKLSKDELPERMQSVLERADTDKDGSLSKEELTKFAQSQPAVRPGGPSERR
jgi:Ca2+-binding EF-hand superfamily protein